MDKQLLTLCLITERKKILLGLKKRGFGANLWNGFGGKVNPDESIEEAAKREVSEEIGINVSSFTKRAILTFNFENDPKTLEVHVFLITKYTGIPTESEEMMPEWFSFENIPYSQMWEDDKYWMPLFLKGKSLRGTFLFTPENKLITHTLNEVKKIT